MSDKSSGFRHVNYGWDDDYAATLDPVGRLVYRSNLLGADGRITNTGGGNTSSKLTETDPLTGDAVEVLWVKGSGGDLRTSKRENFSSLYMDKLRRPAAAITTTRPTAAPRRPSRTPSSPSTAIAPSISTPALRPLTRRCTPSCRTSMWITCTPTP